MSLFTTINRTRRSPLARIIRFVVQLSIGVTVVVAVTGCGAVDNVKLAKAGVDTSSYISSVQPQLQAYGATLSALHTAGPVSPSNAASFKSAQGNMTTLINGLEDVQPDSKYQSAHAKLIKDVESTKDTLSDMETASTEQDQAAYSTALQHFADDQAKFGEAMNAVLQPVVDAAK